ncbi:MAG: DUF4124 domain-containing protein [Pseudomonadales bacterium]|nr:DUF4124 domain-containing protein [Pseudomonadales bacterium]
MLRRLITLGLTSLLCLTKPSFAANDTIYRSTDKQGNVTYSDMPADLADEITLPEPSIYQSTPAQTLQRTRTKSATAKAVSYRQLNILSPLNNTAIRSNNGSLDISFECAPQIRPGHSFQLLIDDQVRQTLKQTGTVGLQNVDRGSHKIQLQIIEDSSGKILYQGPSITTTILRFSKLQQRPLLPPAGRNRTILTQLISN